MPCLRFCRSQWGLMLPLMSLALATGWLFGLDQVFSQVTRFLFFLSALFFLSLLSSTLINSITNIKISSKMSVATAKRSKHLTSVRGSTISQVHCLFRLCNGWLKVWKSWSRRSCSFLPLASVSDTTTEKGLSQINPNILLRYVASFRNSSGFLRN